MFNSQKISKDPKPYKVIESGHRFESGRYWADSNSAGNFTTYAPRPEYDNNPNPILVAFREYCAGADSRSIRWAAGVWALEIEYPHGDEQRGTVAGILDDIAAVPRRKSYVEATERHARRVLARLAALK